MCLFLCIFMFVSLLACQVCADNRNLIVYITLTGGKYHDLDCYTIENSRLLAITLEEAVFVGYTPCKKCHPEEADFSTTGWPESGVLPGSLDSAYDWWKPAA